MPLTKRLSKPVGEDPRPFTAEERAKIRLAQRSFAFFLHYIYPESFGGQLFPFGVRDELKPFTLSRIHFVWASIVEQHTRVCILAPRAHLKSTVVNHAFLMWRMFAFGARGHGGKYDAIVMSYNDPLASKHTSDLKECIRENPYCRFWVDRNPMAKSIVDFDCRFDPDEQGWHGEVLPFSIFSNIRGRHPRDLMCDDILSDFANPLEPTQIRRIHRIYTASLESVPTEKLILIGTPQSYEDTLYQTRKNPEYFWARFPAEWTDKQGNKRVQWPENFDAAKLRRVRRRLQSPTAYQVEYLLVPVMATDSFILREIIDESVDPDLHRYTLDEPFENPHDFPVYGGMDVGKAVHPSHLAVFAQTPDRTLVQVYSRFLDGMDYRAQKTLVNKVVKHFGVKRLYYDNTRSELEDRGLTRSVIGKKFGKRLKAQIALGLENRFFPDDQDEMMGGIVLFEDERQTNQLVAVNKKLESLETEDGHGDAFWSVALAVQAASDGPVISILGNVQDSFGGRARPSTLAQYPK